MAEFNRHLTASAACSAVMRTLGLTPPASFAETTDKTAAQFWTLATEVGQQLMDMHKWQMLNNEYTIVTVDGVSTYDLPPDFNGFVNDSQWNRTSQQRAIGSLEEFEWQMLQANTSTGELSLLFRIADDQVQFRGLPAAGQTVVMPYNSRGWVREAGGTYRDNLEADTDIVLLDPTLFKVALRKMWMEVKQFDTTKVEREFMRAVVYARGKDKPGRTLSLFGVSATGGGTIDGLSIPSSGFGSVADTYDLAASLEGAPTSSQDILPDVPMVRALYFPANFAGSQAELAPGGAPTAEAVFTITKNGVSIGTITFAAGSLIGVFAGGDVSIAIGDQIGITAPAVVDATLAGPGFILVATVV